MNICCARKNQTLVFAQTYSELLKTGYSKVNLKIKVGFITSLWQFWFYPLHFLLEESN